MARRLALCAVVALTACPPPEPGPEVAAAYLGLAADRTVSYVDNNDLDATLEIKPSSVLVDDALVFDIVGKGGGGFVDQNLTFTIAVGVDAVSLPRFGDCVTECRQPNAPVAFPAVPLKDGDFQETEVDVAVTQGAVEAGNVAEKHSFTVGDEAELTVPAGTFTALDVAWTRTRDGDVETALLKIVPGGLCTEDNAATACADAGGVCVDGTCANAGIASWDSFDGVTLRRK